MLKEGQPAQNINIDQLSGKSLGKYYLERLLGRGELSTVYIAQHPEQGHKVMITMFKLPASISAQEREQLSIRFAQEASILVKFAHPNIVPMYDFGELFGHPYLITAFVTGASLRQIIRRQGRFAPQQILIVLRQVASALDYAHSNGVVHDLLNLSNVVRDQELTSQVVGFGLKTVVEAHRSITNKPAQMWSGKNGSLANSPIPGALLDNRPDIYALGMILFELLSGTMPFSQSTSNVSSKYLQSPPPSIHALYPEIPESVDSVIRKALEPNPAKRYARASDVIVAFERVLSSLGILPATASSDQRSTQDEQMTLPPTVNWFNETGKWQSQEPAAAVRNEPAKQPPLVTVLNESASMPMKNNPDSIVGVDPFSWWSATGAKPAVSPPVSPVSPALNAPSAPLAATASPASPGTFSEPARPRSQAQRRSRRKVVALLAAGVATAGVLTVGGVTLAQLMQNKQQSSAPLTNTATNHTTTNKPYHTTTTTTANKTTKGAAATNTKAAPAAQTKAAATPASAATQPPTATPAPAHTGTVLGYTSQAVNSSQNFTNPTDGQPSLLIRLPNGTFVASERACTHQQVLVNYDPVSQMIVCPAHGSVFDPANGFSRVSGPAMAPLKAVAIRMNADGTITTA